MQDFPPLCTHRSEKSLKPDFAYILRFRGYSSKQRGTLSCMSSVNRWRITAVYQQLQHIHHWSVTIEILRLWATKGKSPMPSTCSVYRIFPPRAMLCSTQRHLGSFLHLHTKFQGLEACILGKRAVGSEGKTSDPRAYSAQHSTSEAPWIFPRPSHRHKAYKCVVLGRAVKSLPKWVLIKL